MQKRGLDVTAAEILILVSENRKRKQALEALQNERNRITKLIAQNGGGESELKKDAERIKSELPLLEHALILSEKALYDKVSLLPNIPEEDVPFGLGETDNVEIKKHGTIREFPFNPKEHFELGKNLRQMDFEHTAKISGSRFVTLSDDLALLERALANFMLDLHTTKFGYTEVAPPALVRDIGMFNSGQLPKFVYDSFMVADGKYWLIPTAEVPLTNIALGRLFLEEELPMRVTAHTPCFRSEAGSAGRDTHGMIRLHQFNKVELVSMSTPAQSKAELDRMINAAEEILKLLELPYRIVLLCSQDMSFTAQKAYDIEVWLPGQKQYREISSCSNCGSFQAERMKARYKDVSKNKNLPIHTLNGSGLAVGRTLIAILENYQEQGGCITIPDVLKPYMRGKSKIEKTSKKLY